MISFLVEKLKTEFENYDWGIFEFITIKIKYYGKQLVFEQDSKQYKKFHFKIQMAWKQHLSWCRKRTSFKNSYKTLTMPKSGTVPLELIHLKSVLQRYWWEPE